MGVRLRVAKIHPWGPWPDEGPQPWPDRFFRWMAVLGAALLIGVLGTLGVIAWLCLR